MGAWSLPITRFSGFEVGMADVLACQFCAISNHCSQKEQKYFELSTQTIAHTRMHTGVIAIGVLFLVLLIIGVLRKLEDLKLPTCR